MNCIKCGKEHSLVYPESVNARLRDKGLCIECERWIDLIDEIQVNPEHLMVNGNYIVIESKSFEEVKGGNYFCFQKDGVFELLYSNSLTAVGRPPFIFKDFFPDNAKHIVEED